MSAQMQGAQIISSGYQRRYHVVAFESEAWTALEQLPRFLETRIGGDAEVHVAE